MEKAKWIIKARDRADAMECSTDLVIKKMLKIRDLQFDVGLPTRSTDAAIKMMLKRVDLIKSKPASAGLLQEGI